MNTILTALPSMLFLMLFAFTNSPHPKQTPSTQSLAPNKIGGQPVYWLKWGHDTGNTGWNAEEFTLHTGNVNPLTFGKLWEIAVEGQVYAQPLFVGQLRMVDGYHDTAFVCTEHNSVYALDARTGKQLWKVSLGTSVPSNVVGCGDLVPEYGITGTPVIDPTTQRMYVVAKTLENGVQLWRLHALNVVTGKETIGWGMVIKPPLGFPRKFSPEIQLNRTSLTLANKRVYVGFGSHCDISLSLYHGWLYSYDTTAPLKAPLVWDSTPTSTGSSEAAGGIWMGGASPGVDQAGNLFLITGNGPMNVDLGFLDVGDAFVKLTTNAGLSLAFTGAVTDYFSPSNQVYLDAVDADLGSGGLVMIPDQRNTITPHLLAGGGKDALLRLVNRDDMGAFTGRTDPTAPNNVLQEIGGFPNGFWSTPAYADAGAGPSVYVNAVGDVLKQFRLGVDKNGKSMLTMTAASIPSWGYPSATPVISSRGNAVGSGVVWLLNRRTSALHAFDATNVAVELYNSSMNPGRDGFGTVVKFTVPIVAGGRVLAGGDNKVACYGLLPGNL